MKRYHLLVLAFVFPFLLGAQEENQVLGNWLTGGGESKINIKKCSNGTFCGEIVWLKNPDRDGKPKTDIKNPDEKLRSRPQMGLMILTGFVYDKKDKEWVDGTIYDPKEGKTYKCLMWFEKDLNVLHVKGYIGFSLIGKEVEWIKVK